MAGIRVSGMYSGLDTESIISELASARSVKIQSMEKAQTKLSWKIDAWKELNTKIYDLYSDTLSSLRFTSSYSKKTTTASDSSKVSVTTSSDAMNAVQSLQITNLAKTGYMTGGKISTTDGTSATTSTTLADLGITSDSITFNLGFGTDGSSDVTELTFTSESTISDVLSSLKEAGVNATFDATNQRLFISSTESGASANFVLSAADGSEDALELLGLSTTSTDEDLKAVKITGEDATIILNNATFTSSSNTFEVNGLTLTVSDTTDDDETITLTTANDTSGIYDMIKDFLSKYNELIIEMDTLYNADDASDYMPLTSEEKDAMSDTEVEEWETKIKESLLRRDSTLYSVANAMKSAMAAGIEMSDGTTMYLSDLGINKLSYFSAEDNEKYVYHIDGDEDDSDTKNNTDKLLAAITSDPDKVTEFFTSLTSSVYSALTSKMSSTELSSAFTVYNDKQLKSQLEDYAEDIEDAQDKLDDYIDRWYDKFTAMETALAKLQSNSSAVSSLLGS
ncbi:MAG: flagellar filament capping protein FliD [Lachnospiraceae bacterium]|nr:flagellar filament capping protein FliD [Lachnospiraceae bacterium]